MSIRVPDSLHRAIKDLAKKDGYSINQFLITAAAEKLSSLDTIDYLQMRAERADLDAFDRIMTKIPNGTPVEGDEIPDNYKRRTRSGI